MTGFLLLKGSGETGIRTPEGLASLTVFKTAAFNHSAISPAEKFLKYTGKYKDCFSCLQRINDYQITKMNKLSSDGDLNPS